MKSKRTRIRKAKNKFNKKLFFLPIAIFFIVFLLTNLVNSKKFLSLNYKPGPTPTVRNLPTPTPTPTLSPTPTPTPTPIPKPNGFCLNIPVLMYHHVQDLTQAKEQGHQFETVSPEIFDQQMQYLVSHGYRTIKADELVNAIISHQSLGKVIVVTLDDGYDDAYSNAFQIARKYGVILNLMIPTGLLNNNGFMSWDQLREIASNGNGVYDHTWSHFSLNAGSDEKVNTEIMTAKQQLDSNIGGNVDIFTYPYGSFSERVVNILRADGFKAAFSTIPGTLQCEGNIMSLFRTRIGNAPLSAYGIY